MNMLGYIISGLVTIVIGFTALCFIVGVVFAVLLLLYKVGSFIISLVFNLSPNDLEYAEKEPEFVIASYLVAAVFIFICGLVGRLCLG